MAVPSPLTRVAIAIAATPLTPLPPWPAEAFIMVSTTPRPWADAFERDRAAAVTAPLETYEQSRLGAAQTHVEQSEAAGASYLSRQNRRRADR